jgi:hypothetical protein
MIGKEVVVWTLMWSCFLLKATLTTHSTYLLYILVLYAFDASIIIVFCGAEYVDLVRCETP